MSPEKLQETQSQLQLYWQQFQAQKLSAQDVTGLFWLSYYHLFPENLSFQIQTKNKHLNGDVKNSYQFKNDPFIMSILNPKKELPFSDLYSLFNVTYFKNIKSSANKALCLWYQNKFQLHVVDYIPSPLTVLKWQTKSERCISLLKSSEELKLTYEHDRNVQQFLLHDLEHAWQMFGNPALTPLQVELSNKLLALFDSGKIQFLHEFPETKKTLDYIFSDMNTHPEHTLSSLKALVLTYFKMNQAASTGVPVLTEESEKQFHYKWQEIINTIDFMSKIG